MAKKHVEREYLCSIALMYYMLLPHMEVGGQHGDIYDYY
jgi:hypothetical protein